MTRGTTGRKSASLLAGGPTALFFEVTSASSNVVNALGREIVSGGYPEGGALPNEATMLERFGISRTVLREAYSKLTAKGLVQARPKVGTSVRPRTHWNMLDHDVLAWHLQTVPADDIASDLYTLRRMVEPGAAELAARMRTDADLERIENAVTAMKQSAKEEAALVEADFSFHVAVLQATHNPFINVFSSLIRAAMLSVFEMSWRGAEVIKDHRLMQHEIVANAIRDRDPALARTRMEELLDESIKDALAAASKQ